MDPKDQSSQNPGQPSSDTSSSQDNQSSQGSAPFLTDPVMPEEPSNTSQPQASDQNEPKSSQSFPQPPQMDKKDKQTNKKQKTDKSENQPPPPTPPKSPSTKAKPAQPPSRSSLKPVLLIAIILIVIAALAGGAYFYMQNQALKDQLNSIQANLQPTTSPTPTPTPTANPTASPDSYPTVEITASPTPTSSPQPTISSQNLTAFSELESVITLAQQNHPQAQLLMITSDNILSSPVYKFWFRNQPDLKDYFNIKLTPSQGLEYISYATVTPDNNIPNLIPFWQEDNLGQSDQQLLSKAQQEIDTQTDQSPSSIAAKFIRSRPSNPQIQDQINLWQFSFKFSNQNTLIVQYNAQNQQLVYKNF